VEVQAVEVLQAGVIFSAASEEAPVGNVSQLPLDIQLPKQVKIIMRPTI